MPMMQNLRVLLLILALAASAHAADPVARDILLPPTPVNPRNSEGAFVTLKDGRILLIYTRFTGGRADHAAAELCSRVSADGGRTWSEKDELVVPRGDAGMNVMSVSLLRLKAGRIALLYLVKNSNDDCRPHIRFSDDEARTWTAAEPLIDDPGYYVVNNDRLVQLSTGRLVAPAAKHDRKTDKPGFYRGVSMCFLSDDDGLTWRLSESKLQAPADSRSGLQEPLVVELTDERLMMLCRTDLGSQFRSYSGDAGHTWTPAEPTGIASPLSPATLKRIPRTGHLLMIWNDHRNVDATLKGKRTPLSAAISRDDGKTWGPGRTLESDPKGWYCYTALHFTTVDRVLLAHCTGQVQLATTQVTSFPIDWLYRD
jgi:sialidase-1